MFGPTHEVNLERWGRVLKDWSRSDDVLSVNQAGFDESGPVEQRLGTLERRFEVLKYPIVGGGEVLEPVGLIADFSDDITDPVLAQRASRDFLPIPHRNNREGYCADNHARYWMTGLEDYDKVVAALDCTSVKSGRLYDFGGSTGRVFRHFFCQGRSFEVWTSDFKLANFVWNQRHMPCEVRVFLNGFYPTLPIPDNHFDLITAFSVFTHIDELESPWLLELRRVLRPGGLLYATIHDEAYWGEMSESVLTAIRSSSNGGEITSSSPFPAERTAFHFTEEGYYSCNVFHPHDYVRREWGRFFDILDVRPTDHQSQCVVLMTY
jgi:SAM-dependent methyltransferase